ncbi:Response regulator of zinc sigma-54-dependent two-component system [Minicystis rosea]|nr:Response regulator of zinc sigma-54-dependent two-component system [Minicystis rosea]
MENPDPPSDFDDISTVLQARYQPDREPGAAFAITVIEGPDRGARLVVDGSQPAPILVGHSPTSSLRLTDRQVSRRHAALDVDGSRVRITDLQSANGTFVDGVSVLDAYLRGGEVVRVGTTALRIDHLAEPPPPIPSTDRCFGRLLGASVEMRRLYPLAQRLAEALVPAIIEGETGTGKEVLAEAIHEASARAAGPYVVLDCTTVSSSLVESELFGHERGAFTGAVSARKGVFEQAHGGTLLIDEIGDLELGLQAKLLRAIERREVRRVGGDRRIQVDVRVIAATRRNLDREVQEGRFRDDLFHRLAVARIELPPLRRRRGDVAMLAQHFWRELGDGRRPLSNELLQRWEDYSWPGNVRELRNAVARQLAVGDLPRGEPELANEPPASAGSPRATADAGATVIAEVLAERLPLTMARVKVVEVFEQLYIEQVLADHGGNVVRAAAASGIARRYFQILRSRRRR